MQLVGPACRHRRVELLVDAADAAVSLSADEEQLRHLLLNLVLNAVEAVAPGGQVRIVSRIAADEVTVAIHDTGPGPPADVADRLFEPFSTGKPEGIGLGLTVARQIAEAHGGSLSFSNEDGTCFTVMLPLRPLDGVERDPGQDSNDPEPVAATTHLAPTH